MRYLFIKLKFLISYEMRDWFICSGTIIS